MIPIPLSFNNVVLRCLVYMNIIDVNLPKKKKIVLALLGRVLFPLQKSENPEPKSFCWAFTV